MPLKDKWRDKINDVDYIDANDINEIAHSVIDMEKKSVENVLYTPQTLTEEQKAQARKNIGIVIEEDDENSSTAGINYTYDGDNESDAHTWVCAPNGAKLFLKVADVPDGGIDLVGGDVSVLVPEWPTNNYTFTITDEMLKTVNGLTQVLYQHAASYDQTPQAMVVICTKAGKYTIDLNGWSTDLNFAQTGIYFMDSREAGGGKYVESLRREGAIEPEENEETPVEYDGNEIQVFTRGLCIGDSITEGVVNYSGGQTVIKKYSYPRVLERLTGVEIVNAGVGGLTSKTWYEASMDSTPIYGTWVNNEWVWHVSPETKEGDVVGTALDYSGFDFAIIHIGINDILLMDDETIESTVATYDTYVSNIITKLKENNVGIKIFLCTIIPSYAYSGESNYATLNAKIREIANAIDDVYLIDLNKYSEIVYGTPYENQHLTAVGYHKMANEIMSLINYTIHNNLADFKWVQFTGTYYTP